MALAAHIHIFLSPGHFSSLSHRTYTASQISYGCIYHIPFTNAKRLLLLPLQKKHFQVSPVYSGVLSGSKVSKSVSVLTLGLAVCELLTNLPARWLIHDDDIAANAINHLASRIDMKIYIGKSSVQLVGVSNALFVLLYLTPAPFVYLKSFLFATDLSLLLDITLVEYGVIIRTLVNT